MYRVKHKIPGLPPMINAIGYSHWAIKAKSVKIWKENVAIVFRRDRPKVPLNKAYLICTRYSDREPDHDNLAISFKACIDSLKMIGIIEDDKSSVVFGREYRWKKAPRNNGFITIEVFDAEAFSAYKRDDKNEEQDN
jgi:Holliday junction resolvase RusA-like endonuclease